MSEGSRTPTGCTLRIFGAPAVIAAIPGRSLVMRGDHGEGKARSRFRTFAAGTRFARSRMPAALKWSSEGTPDSELLPAVVQRARNGLSNTAAAPVLYPFVVPVFGTRRSCKGRERDLIRRKSI